MVGAHDELIDHFAKCYELVARGGSDEAPQSRLARRLLTFPEPVEFGLGYTEQSTQGAGSGGRFARLMADGIAVALSAGLENPKHIEEIGILTLGIGADRISDVVCNVLKERFVRYTQKVAAEHGLRVESHKVRNSSCIVGQGRWISANLDLPTNPFSGQPILLTPKRFLNALPVLNADDWFDSSINGDLRAQLELNLGERVTKTRIIDFARKHPDRIRRWAEQLESRSDLTGYDFGADKKGVVNWDKAGDDFTEKNPIASVQEVVSVLDVESLLSEILNQFQRFVQHQGGWRLLWSDDGTEKPEEALQLAFLGFSQNYFRNFNVELDREVELGRGPVDFKLSAGTNCRLLVEFKKSHNGKFWNGLKKQLTSYMESDDCGDGWFVAARYREGKQHDARVKELRQRTMETSQELGANVKHFLIDARRPASASKIT